MCSVVYEDNHLLIVQKPPGMLTQGDITGDDCLYEAMKRYIKQKYDKPGQVYLGLIHRLDRPVGGLVALARTGKAAARLSQQLRQGDMRREYLAVIEGEMPESRGELRDFLLTGEDTRTLAVPEGTPGAKEALLYYRTLQSLDGTSLMHITLGTGRKHQIRAQLAHAGRPVLCDMRYGTGKRGFSPALWGAVLRLTHPVKRVPMTFTSAPQGAAFSAYSRAIQEFLEAQP